MRGRRRSISSLLAESLSRRSGARLAALKAAFAEACGQPLAREAAVGGLTGDGRLVVVARSADWARELERLAEPLCQRVSARVGTPLAGLAVHVGRLPERD